MKSYDNEGDNYVSQSDISDKLEIIDLQIAKLSIFIDRAKATMTSMQLLKTTANLSTLTSLIDLIMEETK